MPFIFAFFLMWCVPAAASFAALWILCRARSDQFTKEKLELTCSSSVSLRRKKELVYLLASCHLEGVREDKEEGKCKVC